MTHPVLSPLPYQQDCVFAIYSRRRWWDRIQKAWRPWSPWDIEVNRNSYCIYPRADSTRRALSGMGFDIKNPQPSGVYRHKRWNDTFEYEAMVVEFQNVDP